MITARCTPVNNQLALEISYPGERKKPVYKYVINQREANIVTYQFYRAYIHEKLNNWLSQRSYGLTTIDPHRAQMAYQLKVLINVFEKATLKNICRHVVSHQDNYTFLAPSEKSRQYKHFTNRIVPVLNFCAEMGGAS